MSNKTFASVKIRRAYPVRIKEKFIIALVLNLSLNFFAIAQTTSGLSDRSEWHYYGGDSGGNRYSPLKQINRRNVTQLQKVWTYHTGEVSSTQKSTPEHRIAAFECTPLMIDGVLYLSTPANRVVALDAETGRELWAYNPQIENENLKYQQHRGVAYWEGNSSDGRARDKRIFFGTLDGRLIALNASTGKPVANFGDRGIVDLQKGVTENRPGSYGVTSPPVIYQNLLIIGAQVPENKPLGPGGDVRAFDVRTGELVWQFHTVPAPGEPGHETWEGDSWRNRTGANVWSIMSVDEERGIVFLPIGSASYDFYGGDRKGQNLYANSLVALNARTGKPMWHYQMVHHDLWDYDLPAQPTLVTIRKSARDIPAVAQVTKMGFIFVLDRLTGRPLFPVEERPVPQSKIPGEASWPTQPFPLKPLPLARLSITRSDISNVTPESHKYCTELFDQLGSNSQAGAKIFTPYGAELTLAVPGTLGGGNWSGASFDPASNYLYVNVNEVGAIGRLQIQPDGSPIRYRRTSQWGEFARFWDLNRYPCQQPPWGTLNAINLQTGDIAWKVPLGIVDVLTAHGVAPTGTPNIGGSIVTAGGLLFIAATNDKRFRAFDAQTGQELWTTMLPASGHATPMTYTGQRSGRQYVVVAAGGGGFFSEEVSDSLVAYALPE